MWEQNFQLKPGTRRIDGTQEIGYDMKNAQLVCCEKRKDNMDGLIRRVAAAMTNETRNRCGWACQE